MASMGFKHTEQHRYQPSCEDSYNVNKPMSMSWPAPNTWVFITELGTALQHFLMPKSWI